MKKIITAVGNPMLNCKIKEIKDYQVVTEDIKTDEELIEWLERVGEIHILFLGSNIIRNYEIDEFIQIIKKIQKNLLIFFFKEENIETSIQEDDGLQIYTTLDLDLKILEKMLQKALQKDIKKYTSKTIAISGANGVGKSTFSTFLAQNVEKQNIKTLLIDFDLEENQVRTLLKIKKQPQYIDNIKDLILKINKNLDVLCHLDLIFSDEIDFLRFQSIMNRLKEEYNLILIDTSSRFENEYTKRIFYNSDKVIFLLEPNILGIKKAKNMLEVFQEDWKIANEKINLLLNKTNIYQISDTIIEELFPDFKLLGKMKYMDSYNLMINRNVDKKEIRKEYERICKKLFK